MPKNTTVERKHFFGMPGMLKTLDLFGAQVPAFNVRGRNTVSTHCGGCMSLAIMYITFVFATLKLQHLISHHNPSVNDYVEKNAFDHTVEYSPKEKKFKLALRVQNYLTGEMMNDTSFVKWFAEYMVSIDGNRTSYPIDMHLCTDEDYESFFEPTAEAATRLTKIRNDGGMMCIDWEQDDLFFSGYETNPDYKTLDIMFLPCSVDNRKFGGTESGVPENCNFEKEKLLKYLDTLQMIIYYNAGEFQLDEFDQHRIRRSSYVHSIQIDPKRPNWIETTVQQNLLADETGFLQWGIADEEEYTTINFKEPRPSSMT